MTPSEIANKWHGFRFAMPSPHLITELERDIKVSNIEARIQERKDHIYVLEQDLMDNSQDEGEGLYTKEYCKFMADEISNHRAYITDLEKELENLK